jgi:hypothetical protein
MDRRLFLRGLMGAPLALAALAAGGGGAVAAPLPITRDAIDAALPAAVGAGAAPDGTPILLAQRRRRYRQVCRVYRDRWGRRFRRCRWVRVR